MSSELEAHAVTLLDQMASARGSELRSLREAWLKFIQSDAHDLGELLTRLLLAANDPIRRDSLIAGLTYTPAPTARHHLEKLLLSADENLNREDIVEALELIHDPASEASLLWSLKHADPEAESTLRVKIASALGAIGGPSAEHELELLQSDPDDAVAEAAQATLSRRRNGRSKSQ